MIIKGLRTFLPSIDYKISKEFYKDLGFLEIWSNEDLTIFGNKEHSFFLQNGYAKIWAENMMIQLFVEDLDELFEISKSLVEKYENIKLKPIFMADYGRTFHLIGPAGELWHMMDGSNR